MTSTRNRAGPGRASSLRILFLEPFDAGSHRAFARGWAARSRHRITLAALPGRFWKWRLRGAAFAFAERIGGRLEAFDAVVATSLMNAAEFAAAARLRIPLIVYAHENQLSYPRPPGEPLDHGLALASLASAAAADAVVFNSAFHREAFSRGLDEWMARFPELAPARTARAIRRRSVVTPPGIDWEGLAPLAHRGRGTAVADGEDLLVVRLDRAVPGPGRKKAAPGHRRARQSLHGWSRESSVRGDVEADDRQAHGPLVLWNHRWEFDKNAPAFFWALEQVERRGRKFRLALLGENTQFVPKPFLEARTHFRERIVRYGYVPSDAAYRAWLGRADLVVSTARQENFGLSVAEAVAAGAFPLLPARLSYPGLLPERFHSDCLYHSQHDLVRRLDRLLARPDLLAKDRLARSRAMRRYDWSQVVPRLDALIDRVALRRR